MWKVTNRFAGTYGSGILGVSRVALWLVLVVGVVYAACASEQKPEGYIALSSGYDHSCAIKTTGEAVCWGTNDDGEASPPDERFVEISAGTSFTCAITEDASVKCWGYRKITASSPPTDLKFVAISSGYNHVCGLLEDGRPKCWGGRWAEVPTELQEDNFVAITSSYDFTCAVREDDSEICWGLAEGETVKPLKNDFVAISGGYHDACGLKETGTIEKGTIFCWNKFDGDVNPYFPMGRRRFEFLGSHAGGASSDDYRCAVDSDRQAVCWSSRYRSSRYRRDVHVEAIPSEKGFLEVSTGQDHACGLHVDGSIICWGENSRGQTIPPTLTAATPILHITDKCFAGQILQKGSGCLSDPLPWSDISQRVLFQVTEDGRGDVYMREGELSDSYFRDFKLGYCVENGHERCYTTLKTYPNGDGSWTIEKTSD